MKSNHIRQLGIGLLALILGLVFAPVAEMALASPINDVPAGLAASLGITPQTAKIIISIAILASVGFGLSLMRLNQIAVIIIMMGLVGAMVAVGYLDLWLMILIVIIVALAFAAKAKTVFGG